MLSIQKNLRGRRGFTLTEAAIVLGIVGLILGAIWSAAGSVYRNQRVTHTAEQLTQLVQGLRSLYSTTSTATFTTSDATNLIATGVLPRDMIKPTADGLVNLWGGDVTLASATCNGTAGSCFQVTFNNVPREACMDFLMRVGGPGRDTGLVNIGSVSLNQTNVAVTLAQAAAACPSTPTPIVFTYMLKG